MLDIKAVVRDVTPLAAAIRYGIDVNRGGNAHCIHGNRDSSPSMHFFPDGKCYCFSCNKSVDSVDIVKLLYGVSAYAAAVKLCKDFNLGYMDYDVSSPTYRPREKTIWEIRGETKDKLKALYREKAIMEGQFAESGEEVPSEMWLDKMHGLIAKIGKLEMELNNMYYENAD